MKTTIRVEINFDKFKIDDNFFDVNGLHAVVIGKWQGRFEKDDYLLVEFSLNKCQKKVFRNNLKSSFAALLDASSQGGYYE